MSLVFLILSFVLVALAKEKDVEHLQIGVKYKPKDCGATAKAGDTVQVHYKGSLTDGEQFDSSYERGDPLTFRLGAGQVIKGWDQGIIGMCVGEKRKLKIPPALGYGDNGAPPKIPGGATLIFETELVQIAPQIRAGDTE
eukprot:TRINITY_DN4269_c0_g1_i1.p4 TRINITY_DN4269_c0_g1~~TRINITY_DN4269_c0_g1_i1.p4  ORF type:complete len:140 (-),score=21.74 TRINITY_DN4269_c0_g1_i1:293-712(-)